LLVVGAGIYRSKATQELIEFAERTGTPVMCGFRRHDAFPNGHPLFLGSLSPGRPPSVEARARNADVVLAIGTRLGEMTTLGYSIPSPEAQLIHVDASPDVIGKNFPARVAIAADARETLRALLAAASRYDWSDRSTQNAADRTRFEQETRVSSPSPVRSLVDPALVMCELRRQLPDHAVVTSDAGNFASWLARHFPFSLPGTFLGPISGAMGYAVPAAVAAGLVHDGQVPAVAIAGDGGFLMTANELAVAAQYGLNVTSVVFDNSLYGTIRMHQERAYPGRVSGTELWSPDFVKYAEAFGGIGVRIDHNADIADGIRAVLAHPGISILEVAVDPETISVGQTLTQPQSHPAAP
jgi:acetolactate synthase-1/2/3 large subunit